MEVLLTLRNDLRKKVDESQTKLAQAIEKRRKIQDYLSQVSRALKLLSAEVDCLEEENKLLLTELISSLVLERGHKTPPPNRQGSREEPCLSELVSLFDDCNTQDTIETLRQKLDLKYRQLYEDKLELTADRFEELEKQIKTKITISLLDETNNRLPTCELFRKGFYPTQPEGVSITIRIDLLLLSHITHSINKRVLLQQEITQQQRAIAAASLPQLPQAQAMSSTAGKFLTQSTSNINSSFVNQSVIHHPNSPNTIVTAQSPPITNPQLLVPATVPRPSCFVLSIIEYTTNIYQQLRIEPLTASPFSQFINLIRDWCWLNDHSGGCLQITKVIILLNNIQFQKLLFNYSLMS